MKDTQKKGIKQNNTRRKEELVYPPVNKRTQTKEKTTYKKVKTTYKKDKTKITRKK